MIWRRLIAAMAMGVSTLAVAQQKERLPGACPVTLVAEGVRGNRGKVGFVVYSSKVGWPEDYEKSLVNLGVPAKAGDVSTVVEIPPGQYAIAILHDENENKRLDRKGSGRPAEGYGVSNNPKVVLKAPSFRAAALEIACGDHVRVHVRYPDKNKAE